LERAIISEGPETVSAFIAEPIIGTSLTGVVPVPEYYTKVREICDRYDVLFIADEVLTGYGRTGTPSAIEQWGVDADIITWSKAIASGYASLAAVLASERVIEAYRKGSGQFVHGFTYSGNPMSCFVGLQVFRYMQEHALFDRPAKLGAYLGEKLNGLAERHRLVGDVRGRGLLFGLEFVKDRLTKEPLPAEYALTDRVVSKAQEMGVMILPGVRGANYGRGGDHIQISPPYVIGRDEIDVVVDVLDRILSDVEAEIQA
jgi:adenosylmethionine-8-amino-7-oxononanoate aminotransferase